MISKINIIMIIIFCLLTITCSKGKKEFEEAQKIGTKEAYQNFLSKFDKGEYADAARAKLDSIILIEEAKAAPNPGSFAFSDVHPIASNGLTRCMLKHYDSNKLLCIIENPAMQIELYISNGPWSLNSFAIWNSNESSDKNSIILNTNHNTFKKDGNEYIFVDSKIKLFNYTFESNSNFPLAFKLLKDKGLVYLCGKGSVLDKKGNITHFGKSMIFEILSENIESEDELKKIGSIQAFGYLGDNRAIQYLFKLLENESNYIKLLVVEALVRLKSPEIISKLRKISEKDQSLKPMYIWATQNISE